MHGEVPSWGPEYRAGEVSVEAEEIALMGDK